MSSTAVSNTPRVPQFDTALLILRIASALAFPYHGSAIRLGALGGPGPVRFTAFLHLPTVIGYLIGAAQLFGAFAMLTGILIRIGAVCIIVVMLGAIFLVHLPHGFDVSKGGMEYALTQLLIAFALLLMGGGAYSLSSRLHTWLQGL